MDYNEIRQKARTTGFGIIDDLLSQPDFIEAAKIAKCHEQNIPARINGKLKKVTRCDYNINPFSKENNIVFNYDIEDWDGSYDMVLDIDVSVFNN